MRTVAEKLTTDTEEKRIDFSSVVPWMNLPWSAGELTFRTKLDWTLAYYGTRLAREGIHLTELNVLDLMDAAFAYRCKILAAMGKRRK